MIRGLQRAPCLKFIRLPIIPDHLEHALQVSEECITDRRKDRPTDGPTDRQTNRPTDRRTDRPTDRPTDGQSIIQKCEDASKNLGAPQCPMKICCAAQSKRESLRNILSLLAYLSALLSILEKNFLTVIYANLVVLDMSHPKIIFIFTWNQN